MKRNDKRAEICEHLDAMWRFAIRLTKNGADAQELVQQTCLRALESKGYSEQGKAISWLFKIEHNLWKNELRARNTIRRNQHACAEAQEHQEQVSLSVQNGVYGETDAETSLYLQQVYTSVENLPEQYKTVMQLICVEECSYSEAADILDIPVGTVMSRLARARLKIGEQFLDRAAKY